MKVTYVISSLDAGGAERQLVNLVNALPVDFEIDIVVLKIGTLLAEHLSHPNIKLHTVNLKSHGYLKGWIHFIKLLRQLKPDIVHSHMFLANLASRLARLFCSCKGLINHEHGLSFWKSRILCFIDQITQFFANKVITVSEASRKIRRKREHITSERLIVLHNAINWDQWSSVPPVSSGNHPSWGIVARLMPIKRIDIAFSLLAEAKKLGSKATLFVAGDGPELKRLKEKRNKFGLADSVKFLGHVKDMRQFYASVDVVLLTSLREDFPICILEGLAAGKFVIAPRVGGIPEILGAAKDAVLIDNCNDLLPVAKEVVNIPAGFDSQPNRIYAKQFDITKYAEKTIRLYEEILNQ